MEEERTFAIDAKNKIYEFIEDVFLKQLSVTNFRNYRARKIEFSEVVKV